MSKHLVIALLFIFILITYTRQSHCQQQDIHIEKIHVVFSSTDSTIVPQDSISNSSIQLKGKTNRISRYKNLAKEKERREKIRAKYKKEKLLKK